MLAIAKERFDDTPRPRLLSEHDLKRVAGGGTDAPGAINWIANETANEYDDKVFFDNPNYTYSELEAEFFSHEYFLAFEGEGSGPYAVYWMEAYGLTWYFYGTISAHGTPYYK